MKLIIDIPEEIKATIDRNGTNEIVNETIWQAVKNGTPLEQEPCDDAISRQAVLDYIDEMPSDLTADGRRMIRRRTLEEYISDTLPPVTPQPKTGHWILIDKAHEHAHCSECDYGNVDLLDGRPHNYCPNCGARMESEDIGDTE